MKAFNTNRVKYYGRYDMAAGVYKDRIKEILLAPNGPAVESINDAVEIHQCKLTVENIPELYEDDELTALKKAAASAFSCACRFVHTALQNKGLIALYDSLEKQYFDKIWLLFEACGAEKHISGKELETFLVENPHCLKSVLQTTAFAKHFDVELRNVMLKTPNKSAVLIMSALAIVRDNQVKLHLPEALTQSDYDAIMLAYLEGEHPNSNYVEVLTRWPDSEVSKYCPSPKVRVKAKKVNDALTKMLFADGAGIRYGVGVAIDMEQRACKGLRIEGLDYSHDFSGQWLETYMDNATVMNNCRFIFDYLDEKGLMQMPAHDHEEIGFISTLGTRVRREYRDNIGSKMRQYFALLETIAYADFLEKHDQSLEDALGWVYNTYFIEEFGINGFSIALPSRDGSWLDRCKGIGIEIERAIKEYQLYEANGSIDEDYLVYERFKSFADVKSLVGNKFAVEGDAFNTWATPLFSDQSLLGYVEGKKGEKDSFYSLLDSVFITRDDYQDFQQADITLLIEKGFITEDADTGRLAPTLRSSILQLVWDSGAVVLELFTNAGRKIIADLVNEGYLKYHDGLFTPDEASYLNYMLNDSDATNALALRNKYNHATGPVSDPNAQSIKKDYYAMLMVLIVITLRINAELRAKFGGDGGIDFVDWPLYDDSVFEAAENLALME